MHGERRGDLLDVENGIHKVFPVVLCVGGIVGTQELRSPTFDRSDRGRGGLSFLGNSYKTYQKPLLSR
jgi:hypothetical protein